MTAQPITRFSELVERLPRLLPPEIAGAVSVDQFNIHGAIVLVYSSGARPPLDVARQVEALIPATLDGLAVRVVWRHWKQRR